LAVSLKTASFGDEVSVIVDSLSGGFSYQDRSICPIHSGGRVSRFIER
jgi:hypothetical protein